MAKEKMHDIDDGTRYVDDMSVIGGKNITETRCLVIEKLKEINMRLNEKKSIISEVKYGINFLGIKINPYYSVLGKRRIGRMWYTSRCFETVDKAYRSCSSRKGMIRRYHGKRISERWYDSLPQEFKNNLKMDTQAKFYLVGSRALPDKNKLRNIRLYPDREGDDKCTTSMKTAS